MAGLNLLQWFVPAKWKVRGEVKAQGEGQLALGSESLAFWQERLGWSPTASRYLATAFTFGARENVADVLETAQRLSEADDFASRFANRLQDDLSVLGPALDAARFVSADELHELLGRILASDVDHPGSISRRAVSIAQDLTADQLREFLKLRSATWTHDRGSIVVLGLPEAPNAPRFISFNSRRLGINYLAFGEFQQLGLLQELSYGLSLTFDDPTEEWLLHYGSHTVSLLPINEDSALVLGTYSLTRAGEEILNLFLDEEFLTPNAYFEEVCEFWRAHGFDVKILAG